MKRQLMVYYIAGDYDGGLSFGFPILDDGIELLQEGSVDLMVFFQSVTINRIGDLFKLHNIPIPVRRLDDYCLNSKLI
jgi:hypothetical protein